jgi:hypothetical protein
MWIEIAALGHLARDVRADWVPHHSMRKIILKCANEA